MNTTAGLVEAWPFFGYVPGKYMVRCLKCDDFNYDLDERAISCLECAVKQSKAFTAELQATRTPEASDTLEMVVEALSRILSHPNANLCECGKPECATAFARAALAKAGAA